MTYEASASSGLPLYAPSTITDNSSSTEKAEAPYGWILHPVVDMMFCCGGLIWLMYFACAFAPQAALTKQFLWAAGIIGILLFGVTHAPATFLRVYASKHNSKTLTVTVTISGLLLLALGVIGLKAFALLIILGKILQIWYLQHFYAQLFGVSLIYCYKRGYVFKNWEKQILLRMTQAAALVAIVGVFTYLEYGRLTVYDFSLPFWGPLPEWIFATCQVILVALTLAFAAVVGRKYFVDKEMMPIPALCTLATGIILFAVMRKAFDAVLGSVIIGYFFHNCQYLTITASYYFKEHIQQDTRFANVWKMFFTWRSARYFAIVMSIGVFISYLFPLWLGDYCGVDKVAAFTMVFVVLNLHHYFSDAFVWRLRDKNVQKLLIS